MEKPDHKYLSAFREIEKNINSTVSFQEILDLTVEKVTCFLGVKGASMLILDHAHGGLKSSASYGLNSNCIHKELPHTEESIFDATSDSNFLEADPVTDPHTQYRESVKQEGIGKILSMPLAENGDMFGVLKIYFPEGYEFSQKIIGFLKILCPKIAMAVRTAFQYEAVEEKHESIMFDVWKWMKIRSYSYDTKVNNSYTPIPFRSR